MQSLTLSTIETLPQQNISDLTQLEWSVENWQIEYGKCAVNTSDAYRLFDEAIDRGILPDERKVWGELIDLCETAQSYAYLQLENAKRELLEKWN